MKTPIKAVLFDFDGTLTTPGGLDFQAIRDTIQCPRDTPVLEFIDALQEPAKREQATRVLQEFEAAAAASSMPNHGAQDIVRFLRARGIPVGILTRNSRCSVLRALHNFDTLTREDFAVILTRDDSAAPKPDPEGVLFAATRMKTQPQALLVVDDYLFDIQAGHRAGAQTALLQTGHHSFTLDVQPNYTLATLPDLKPIILAGTCA